MQQQRIPTEADWAWLAGLFEGEGCIVFMDRRSVRVVIQMCDRDVLERVDRLVPSVSGVGVAKRSPNPRHSQKYLWYLTSRDDVVAFIEGIRPWLLSRRGKRADEALARLATNRGWSSHKTHCRHGHVWAEVGVYVRNNKRHCRACMKESADRYRAKHREQYLKNHRERERERRKKRSESKG